MSETGLPRLAPHFFNRATHRGPEGRVLASGGNRSITDSISGSYTELSNVGSSLSCRLKADPPLVTEAGVVAN